MSTVIVMDAIMHVRVKFPHAPAETTISSRDKCRRQGIVNMYIPSQRTDGPKKLTRILAGELFDPYTCKVVKNKLITVSQDSGLVIDVDSFNDLQGHGIARDSDVIDLRKETVLPGLVDVHVHCECRNSSL